MGGRAFRTVLPLAAFPRISPAVYKSLKAYLYPKLSELYTWVGVPIEAPEKLDYGDLDFVVAIPKIQSLSHQVIKEILGAKLVIPMEGNRTSNYAIPISPGEWGHSAEEDDKRKKVTDGLIFYQVDVHVCVDKDEWDRIMFYNSYGDLCMILGLIARNVGLSLGSKGLKIPDPPNPPFDLSESIDDIANFFGLSLGTYNAGFKTKQAFFEWVTNSRLFDAKSFRSDVKKVKPGRKLYGEFVEWAEKQRNTSKSECGQSQEPVREEWRQNVQQEALIFFKRKEAFDVLGEEQSNKIRLKKQLSESTVHNRDESQEECMGAE